MPAGEAAKLAAKITGVPRKELYAVGIEATPSKIRRMDRLTITRPDDWHLHLRDGPAMASVLADTARRFGARDRDAEPASRR